MKSLTIHNIETDLVSAIENLSKASGLSQSKVVKKLLRRALGMETKAPRKDFSAFCGLWSNEEAEAFHEAVKSLEGIDKDPWQ